MQKLYLLKQSIFSKDNTSIYSIALISVLLFTMWTIAYSLIIFEQFSWVQIISVSISFFLILFLFTKFFTELLEQRIEITFKNIIYSFLLFLLMCLLSSTLPVPAYQLLTTELGMGWFQDTVFHTSLIQSILNFGYPSIAQHGAVFSLYHVLSHYVDSVILFISNIEPYDATGLFTIFRIWLLISSITIFIGSTIKSIHPLLYLFIFGLIAPIFTGTWHPVFSHGLWFTTILIIFSSLKIFRIFMSSKLDNKDLYFIFIVITLITLGKISSGLMYASFVGLFLLIKYPKDKRVYLLGFAWAIFFIFYIKLFSATYGTSVASGYDFSILTMEYFYNTITNWHIPQGAIGLRSFITAQNIMIISSLLLIAFITYFSKSKNTLKILFSAILSYLILVVLLAIKTDLSGSDIFYFYLGFIYVLNLFTFLLIVYNLQNHTLLTSKESFNSIFTATLLITSICISSLYVTSNIKIPSRFSISPTSNLNKMKELNTSPFRSVNNKLAAKNHLTVKKLLLHKVENTYFEDAQRPLYTFRDSINNILTQNNISKRQALLFIPKEIYEKDISKFGGKLWARGMLIYAVTGVPLLYAINNNEQKAYAQQDYNSSHLWKKSENFSFEEVCQHNPSKTILQLVDFDNLEFTVYKCK